MEQPETNVQPEINAVVPAMLASDDMNSRIIAEADNGNPPLNAFNPQAQRRSRREHIRVNSQPGPIDPMATPNLDKLTKGYYRLYSKLHGPFISEYALHADDPSLASFYMEHVPPPRLATSYLNFICSREGIHPSRVALFVEVVNQPTRALQRVMDPDTFDIRDAGSTESQPLNISIELANDETHADASGPLPVWKESRRMLGKGGAKTVHCLAFGLRYMVVGIGRGVMSCPANFRLCWVHTWTCGAPEEFRPERGQSLCCCCWWGHQG